MDIVLLRKLRERLFALDRGKGYTGLEGRAVVSAGSSAQVILLLRRSRRSQAEFPLIDLSNFAEPLLRSGRGADQP